MDIYFLYRGQRFVWDAEKASSNANKHGVRFETACEVFFDPFLRVEDATVDEELRDAVDWPDRELGLAICSPSAA